jgi:hypothetical protein
MRVKIKIKSKLEDNKKNWRVKLERKINLIKKIKKTRVE